MYEIKADVPDMAMATYRSLGIASDSVRRVIVKGDAKNLDSVDDKGANVTVDITPYLVSDADNVLYFAFATATGREQALSAFALSTTPLYKADITVTDGENTLAGAEITMNGYDATGAVVTSITTNESGVASIYLPAGTHAVTNVEKTGYVAPETIDDIVITDADVTPTITMTPQSDPEFDLTINTAPYATVVLDAGTSTQGTEVPTQTVKATAAGVASLSKVPAGSYTVDITTPNKYMDGLTDSAIVVSAETTTFEKPLSYKESYANMLYGDSFSYDAKSDLIGTGYTVNGDGEAFVVNGTSSSESKGGAYPYTITNSDCVPLENQAIEGNFAYSHLGAAKKDRTLTSSTFAKDITSMSFDVRFAKYGTWRNNVLYQRGEGKTTNFKVGDANLFTFTYDGTTVANSAITINTADETKPALTDAFDKWIHVSVTVSEGNATIELTPYTLSGSTYTLDTAKKVTGTVSAAAAKYFVFNLKLVLRALQI